MIQVAGQGADPAVVYLAALSHQRLGQARDAERRFERLVARGEDDPWAKIGRSAWLLNATFTEGSPEARAALTEAEETARVAATLAPGLAQAHYQLGLVHGRQRDYASAAVAFDAAVAANPRFAYAHYYAGLSYYQVKRTDKMATAFEYFLKLAPEAPERAQVESIMRTRRGRR